MASTTTTVLRTEIKLFWREPGSIFWIIAFPAVLVGILGSIPSFREPSADLGGITTITLYVPIGILFAMLMASVSAMPVVLASYREQRVLRRMATTPARPRDLLIVQYAIHGGAAVLGGVLTVVLAWLAFDVALPENAVAYLGMFVLVLIACLTIGGLIASVARTGKVATTIGMCALFPLLFTAGVWLPVAAMPDVLATIVTATPVGAGVVALDTAAAGDWPAARDVGVVLAWTVGLGAVAVRWFRWE